MRLIVAFLFVVLPISAALSDDVPEIIDAGTPRASEMRQGDSLWKQRSEGCFYGAAGGAVLAIFGSAGIGVVPSAGIGCGVGAIAAPAAVDFWNRYRYTAASLLNDAQYVVNRGFDYAAWWLDDNGSEASSN